MFTNTSSESKIQEIVLENVQFRFKQEFDRLDLYPNLKIEHYMDSFTQRNIWEIKNNILGEKNKLNIPIPENWFQMFKRDCFPKWLLKKFPVKNKIFGVLDIYFLYPHLKVSIPEERQYIHFARFEMMK